MIEIVRQKKFGPRLQFVWLSGLISGRVVFSLKRKTIFVLFNECIVYVTY